MDGQPVILDSARKRGYAEDDLLHVVVYAIRVIRQDDGMTMYVGPDCAGNVMEVGVVVLRDGTHAIAYAMRPARAKYHPIKPTERRR